MRNPPPPGCVPLRGTSYFFPFLVADTSVVYGQFSPDVYSCSSCAVTVQNSDGEIAGQVLPYLNIDKYQFICVAARALSSSVLTEFPGSRSGAIWTSGWQRDCIPFSFQTHSL